MYVSQKYSLTDYYAMMFLFILYYIIAISKPIDNDIWHLMALFRESIHLGYIPYRDLFAYTPTIYPCVNHEWGAGAIAFILSHSLGGAGIFILKSILVLFIALFIFRCNLLRKTNLQIFFLLAPIGIAMPVRCFATFRAQIYSYFFFSMLIYFIELDKKGNKSWIKYWIPSYIVWVNLHAGFLLGLFLWCFYTVVKWIQKSFLPHHFYLTFFMVAAIIINPYHIYFYPHLIKSIFMERPHIREWDYLWSAWLPFIIYIYSWIILLYSLQKDSRVKWIEFASLLLWGLLALRSRRLIIFYAMIWLTFVPSMLSNMKIEHVVHVIWNKFSKILVYIFGVSFLILFCRYLYLEPWKILVPGQKYENDIFVYPVGTKEYLTKYKFKGNMIVSFDIGAYLIWKLYPNVRVSMDSRYEAAYPDFVYQDNYDFYQAVGPWTDFLSKYKSDLILIRNDVPIAAKIGDINGWKKVYTDQSFSLYASSNLSLPYEDRSNETFFDTFP